MDDQQQEPIPAECEHVGQMNYLLARSDPAYRRRSTAGTGAAVQLAEKVRAECRIVCGDHSPYLLTGELDLSAAASGTDNGQPDEPIEPPARRGRFRWPRLRRRQPASVVATSAVSRPTRPSRPPIYAVPLRSADVVILVEALEEADRTAVDRYGHLCELRWAVKLATAVRTNAGLARDLGHQTTPLMTNDIHTVGNALRELVNVSPNGRHTTRLRSLHHRLVAMQATAMVRRWTVQLVDDQPDHVGLFRDTDSIRWSESMRVPSVDDLPPTGPELAG